MKVLETSRVGDRWILKVELTREEASLVSTVFGVNVCTIGYVSIDELVGRLLHGIMASSLRESEGGCEVVMSVSGVWLQSIIPAGSSVGEERQLLDFVVKGLEITFKSMVSLARSFEELRKSIVAPCIDPGVSASLDRLLRELPLLCIRGHRIGGSQFLEVILGDSAIPSYSSRFLISVNALPDVLDKTWFRGLEARLGGCIRVEGKDVVVGTNRFRTGLYYVNDCIILEAYIANCRERSKSGTVRSIDVDRLGELRDMVSSFLKVVGGWGNVEVVESGEWLYIRSLKASGSVEEAELCLKRRGY